MQKLELSHRLQVFRALWIQVCSNDDILMIWNSMKLACGVRLDLWARKLERQATMIPEIFDRCLSIH